MDGNKSNNFKVPQQKPENMLCLNQMMIKDGISMLSHTLSAIEKWEKFAWDEFEVWKKELLEGTPTGHDYYDPAIEEGSMMGVTENSLYGSFSVNIAAFVEDQLKRLLTHNGIEIVKPKGKKVKKPHFGDYMYSLKKNCKTSLANILHYNDLLFIRELANRFKHSGGFPNENFIKDFGKIVGVNDVNAQIPYTKLCWKCYIKHTEEFLLDCVQKIHKTKISK